MGAPGRLKILSENSSTPCNDRCGEPLDSKEGLPNAAGSGWPDCGIKRLRVLYPAKASSFQASPPGWPDRAAPGSYPGQEYAAGVSRWPRSQDASRDWRLAIGDWDGRKTHSASASCPESAIGNSVIDENRKSPSPSSSTRDGLFQDCIIDRGRVRRF